MRFLIYIFFLTLPFLNFGQDQYKLINVKQYDVNITVSDKNNEIIVKETVEIEFLSNLDSFYLDLTSVNTESLGMKLNPTFGVQEGSKPISYNHVSDQLWIKPGNAQKSDTRTFTLEFSGTPQNGLIIGKNKFEDRTFFGDNWPNRAHNWFACVDHPSDKAIVNFTVNAPNHYNCIATGIKTGESKGKGKTTIHQFQSEHELPTKVMVVGLAEFSIKNIEHQPPFPFDHSSWVYPQDSTVGHAQTQVANDVLEFFISKIGEYPFEKLANVQSTTMFGGMENAGNIFYDENAFGEGKNMEALIAHEIAHQWFGNSASESDWPHLWLSEGFATYFTDLYWEHKYGEEAFQERLRSERNRVTAFSQKYYHPVIDTTYEDLMHLLNAHSYQKGAWFLHMLRQKVSDDFFWLGIKNYYEQYKYGNASTEDFMRIMEETSQMKLGEFFHQWLRIPLHPTLLINYSSNGNNDVLSIHQRQNNHVFSFILEVEYTFADGTTEIKSYLIDEKREVIIVRKPDVTGFRLDPDVKLLFEQL